MLLRSLLTNSEYVPKFPSETKPKSAPALTHKPTPPVVLRKRKLTVPVHLYDNPYFTSTDVVVGERYEKLQHIASGRFGVVVRAVDSATGERVAIKKVFSAFSDAHAARRALRELRLLRHLRHPNVVHLINVDMPTSFDSWKDVYLVTPLLRTDLRSALLSGELSSLQKRRVLVQLLFALRHLHAASIMHRDVKSLNVLLDDNCNACLCDLGSARFHSSESDSEFVDQAELTVGARTPLTSAPELFLNEAYDEKVDMWGVGALAAEILHPTHRHLFDDLEKRNPMKVVVQVLGFPTEQQMAHLRRRSSKWYMNRLRTKQPPALRKKLGINDEIAIDFVSKLLAFDPSERISAAEALRHPFLKPLADEMQVELDLPQGSNLQLTEPPAKMSKHQLKELAWEEVLSFHPEAESLR